MTSRSSIGSSNSTELTKAERKAAKKARKALKADLHAARVRRAGGKRKKKGGKKNKGKGRPGANGGGSNKTIGSSSADESCQVHDRMLGYVAAIAEPKYSRVALALRPQSMTGGIRGYLHKGMAIQLDKG